MHLPSNYYCTHMARINTPNQKSIEIVYEIWYESVELGIMETGKRHNTYLSLSLCTVNAAHSLDESFISSYFRCFLLVWCCFFLFLSLSSTSCFSSIFFICYQLLLTFLILDLFYSFRFSTHFISFHGRSLFSSICSLSISASKFLCR